METALYRLVIALCKGPLYKGSLTRGPNNLRDTFARTEPWESKPKAKINPESSKFSEINPEKPELQGSQGRTISRASGFLVITRNPTMRFGPKLEEIFL